MLSALVTAFAIACAGAWWLSRAGGLFALVDHPNARSLHDVPTPRSGGLAIWGGALIGAAIALAWYGARMEFAWIGAAALVVGIVALIDDRSHVPAGLRLLAQLCAGGLLVAGGFTLHSIQIPGFNFELSAGFSVIITLIIIIWMSNLYNFMDGIDGLAGGMAVFGFGTLGLLGWINGDGQYAALCGVIAAAAGGFLVWNFPPARIFMGDNGASVLGLLAAALALWGDRLGLFPLWIAVLAFAPFVIDTAVTLVRRLLKGESVWVAHRNHYYQRLAQAGWGHRRTVLWAYGLMSVSCAAALVAPITPVAAQGLIIGLVFALHVAGILGIRRIEQGVRTRRG